MLCGSCLSPYGPGLPHSCNRKTLINNAAYHLDPEVREIISSTVIKELVGPSGDVQLKTSGTPLQMSVTLGADALVPDNKQLSIDDFSELQMSLNLSTRQVRSIPMITIMACSFLKNDLNVSLFL